MGAQPLNTNITVFRRLRTFRENRRHTSIKHLTTPFDGDLVAVPGEEIQVVETRDANFVTDAFRFVQRDGTVLGHPIVVQPRDPCTLATLYAGVSGLDFPVRLPGNPRELQVQNTPAAVDNDLYGDARGVCPSDAFIA
jgi:hypothetical protein